MRPIFPVELQFMTAVPKLTRLGEMVTYVYYGIMHLCVCISLGVADNVIIEYAIVQWQCTGSMWCQHGI